MSVINDVHKRIKAEAFSETRFSSFMNIYSIKFTPPFGRGLWLSDIQSEMKGKGTGTRKGQVKQKS